MKIVYVLLRVLGFSVWQVGLGARGQLGIAPKCHLKTLTQSKGSGFRVHTHIPLNHREWPYPEALNPSGAWVSKDRELFQFLGLVGLYIQSQMLQIGILLPG